MFPKTVYQLKAMGIKGILLHCKQRLDREYNRFLQNPVSYLETIVHLELRLVPKTFCVPFEVEILPSSFGDRDWRSPRVKSSDGFPLYLTKGMYALLTPLVLIFASVALHDKFVFMQRGMFTPDALLYAFVVLNAVLADFVALRLLFCRHEFATIFNAYRAFSENWAGKFVVNTVTIHTSLLFCTASILQIYKHKYLWYRQIFRQERDSASCKRRKANLHWPAYIYCLSFRCPSCHDSFALHVSWFTHNGASLRGPRCEWKWRYKSKALLCSGRGRCSGILGYFRRIILPRIPGRNAVHWGSKRAPLCQV